MLNTNSRGVTRGNITWIDNLNGSVTVQSVDRSFSEFTVGKPVVLIVMDCGHKFHTGADDPKINKFNELLDADQVKYNCIQCGRMSNIVEVKQ